MKSRSLLLLLVILIVGCGQSVHPPVPNAGSSLALFFNVLDYGATGNGVTDDTAAINRAYDAAALNGGTLYFPPHTYLVSSTAGGPALKITGAVNLLGDAGSVQNNAGVGSIIKSVSNVPVIQWFGQPSIGLSMRGLQILGSKSAGTSQIGIEVSNGSIKIDECLVQNTGGPGIQFDNQACCSTTIHTSVLTCHQDGIVITGGSNLQAFFSVSSDGNGRYGFNNDNGNGTITHALNVDGNGSSGIYVNGSGGQSRNLRFLETWNENNGAPDTITAGGRYSTLDYVHNTSGEPRIAAFANSIFGVNDGASKASNWVTAYRFGKFGKYPVQQGRTPGGSAQTVDFQNGSHVEYVLTGNFTGATTFANAVLGEEVTLVLTQGAGGPWTFSWPSNISWAGSVPPSLSEGAGAKDTFTFFYDGSMFNEISRSRAAPGDAPSTRVAVKAADQSVTRSTQLADETALQFEVPTANDVWVVTWTLYSTFAANAGIALAVVVPEGATLLALMTGTPTGGGNIKHAEEQITPGSPKKLLGMPGGGTSGIVMVTATVRCDGKHTGSVKLQFAQTQSSGTATSIKAGSSMTALAR